MDQDAPPCPPQAKPVGYLGAQKKKKGSRSVSSPRLSPAGLAAAPPQKRGWALGRTRVPGPFPPPRLTGGRRRFVPFTEAPPSLSLAAFRSASGTFIGCCCRLSPARARSVSVRDLEGSEERLPPLPLTCCSLSLAIEPACEACPLAAQAAGLASIGWLAGAAPPWAERCVWAGELPVERTRELLLPRAARAGDGVKRSRRGVSPPPHRRGAGAGWPRRAGWAELSDEERSGAERDEPWPPARTMPSRREPSAPRLRDPIGAAALSAPGSA